MPSTTPMTEQKQVNTIFRRYKKFYTVRAVVCLALVCSLIPFIDYPTEYKFRFLKAILLVWTPTILFMSLIRFLSLRKFASQLTLDELKLLEDTAKNSSNLYSRTMAEKLVKLCERSDPKVELLRAAAYTQTTPQDQLLRPADDNEPALSSQL